MRRVALLMVVTGTWATVVPRAEAREVNLDARGYLDVGGGVWSSEGDFGRHGPAAASELRFQFGIGPKRLPFTFGLGAGVVTTASRSTPGPSGVWINDDGSVDFGPTTITQTTELRHAEAVLRLEPDWPRFRPFLEAIGGVAEFWTITNMRANWTGGGVSQSEKANDKTFLYGFGAGLTVAVVSPMRLAPQSDGTGGGGLGIALTVGVRALLGGDIAYSALSTPDGQSSALVPTHATLRVVAPYALLTLYFRTADAAH